MIEGGYLNLHFGYFTHESIVGKPYGSKIKTVSKTQK